MTPTQQKLPREKQRFRLLARLHDLFLRPEGKPKNLAGDMLAVDRTRLAHERTMMAWIRTGLSMITFGFTIYKFFQIEAAGRRVEGIIGARSFGGLMIATGLFSLFLAALQHRREMQSLRAAGIDVPPSLAALIGAMVSLLGILGLLAVIFKE
jgi:putative membrane protein